MNKWICSGYCKTVSDVAQWLNELEAREDVQRVIEFTAISEPNAMVQEPGTTGDWWRPFSVIAEIQVKEPLQEEL